MQGLFHTAGVEETEGAWTSDQVNASRSQPYISLRIRSNVERTSAMLKGISPLLSPDMLKILAEMGHGDEIVLADAHFPGHSVNRRTLRADGVTVEELLGAILPLFELDDYEAPLCMMQPVEGDALDLDVENGYMQIVGSHQSGVPAPVRLKRGLFYDRASSAYAVVMTGDRRKYANLVLKKGVTP